MMGRNDVYDVLYGNEVDSLEKMAKVIENIMDEREKMKERIESEEKPNIPNLNKTLPIHNQSVNKIKRLSFGSSKRSYGAEIAADHHEV